MNKTLLVICIALLLVGCSNLGSAPTPTSPPEEEKVEVEPTPTPTSPPGEEEVLADCFVYFHLTAWLDENANGELDEGELPLPGVELIVDGMYALSFSRGRGISDDEGKATIDTWTPSDCPDTFTISATPLEGYKLTTESPVIVEGPFTGSVDMAFGFQLVEGE